MMSILKTQEGSTCDAAFCLVWVIFLCSRFCFIFLYFRIVIVGLHVFLLVYAGGICSHRVSTHCFFMWFGFFVVTMFFFQLSIWKY